MADKPVTREEKYLAYLTGDYTGELPKPITRKEKYLYELCLKGIGGEISPEEIKAAVNEYLEKNPVKPGATTEQAQQIEQNKTDIASLKTETGSLKGDLDDVIDKTVSPNLVNPINFRDGIKVAYSSNMVNGGNPSSTTNYILLGTFNVGDVLVFSEMITGNSMIAYGREDFCEGVYRQTNSDLYENGMYLYTVTNNATIGVNYDNTKVKSNLYVALKSEYDKTKTIFPFGYKNTEFSENMNGKVSNRLLANEINERFVNIEDSLYRKSATVSRTYSNCVINYNGKLGTLNHWNVAEINLVCGETLTVYGNTLTGDASNLAMCEMFLNGTPLHALYRAGDYSENPMVYTASKPIENIWVLYKDNLNAIVSVNCKELREKELYFSSLSMFSNLKYRYKSAICIGDSLTYGKQTVTSEASRDSYPKFLSMITSMDIVNAGESGATPKSWLTKWGNTYNFADYECAFICLGTKTGFDYNESDEQYNSYVAILNLIKTQNPKCALFLIDCTRDNTNVAIERIANDFDCAYIKNFRNEYYYVGGISNAPITPIHDMSGDTTHLSPFGYLIMANNICNGMVYDMLVNPHRYLQRYSE